MVEDHIPLVQNLILGILSLLWKIILVKLGYMKNWLEVFYVSVIFYAKIKNPSGAPSAF